MKNRIKMTISIYFNWNTVIRFFSIDSVQEQFVAAGSLTVLWKYLEKFYLSDTNISLMCIAAISVVAASGL